jgi:hypothetical protein
MELHDQVADFAAGDSIRLLGKFPPQNPNAILVGTAPRQILSQQ